MGKFNVCMKVVMGKSPSHAWIAFHRCVEANSRLTGESFTSIFERLEKKYGFERKKKDRWPTLNKIQKACELLKEEREEWLREMNELIEKRKKEKKKGKRHKRFGRLDEMLKLQSALKTPETGVWAGKKSGKNKMLGVSFIFALCVGVALGAIPGIIGIIVSIRNSAKKGSRFIVIYLGLTVFIEFLFLFLSNSFFDCGMQNGKQFGNCFYMYVYLGASPGFSLFLGLTALFIKTDKN